MSSEVRLGICMVTYNSMATLHDVLTRLFRYTDVPYVLVAVDNASRDGSTDYLQKAGSIPSHSVRLVLNATNVGYSAAVNQALSLVPAHLPAVLINPDVLVGPHWASRLLAHIHDTPRVAAVGPVGTLIGGAHEYGTHFGPLPFTPDDGRGFDRFCDELYRKKRGHFRTVKLLIGCCMLVTPAARAEVGALDPEMPLGADDFDWSLRARLAGFDLVVAEDVFVQHRKGASTRQAGPETASWADRSWQRFVDKWASLLNELGWDRLFYDDVPTDRPPFRLIVYRGGSP